MAGMICAGGAQASFLVKWPSRYAQCPGRSGGCSPPESDDMNTSLLITCVSLSGNMGQSFLLVSKEQGTTEADSLGSLLVHSVSSWRNFGIPGIEIVTVRGNGRGSEIPSLTYTQLLLVAVSCQKSESCTTLIILAAKERTKFANVCCFHLKKKIKRIASSQ